MTDTAVLVLNQNYEPLNVCTARRAFLLIDRGKAEVLENGAGYLRSPSYSFAVPSVIKLAYLIRRPRPQARLSRREILLRDQHTCQYCGRQTKELTLDHIVPRHRGGKHTWDNVVAACKLCNHRKAGRSPQEARMSLLREPFQPRLSMGYILHSFLESEHGWSKFVAGWDGHAAPGYDALDA